MTGTCVIALPRFMKKAGEIGRHLGADMVPYGPDAFASAFSAYSGIVAVMSAGIVVRSIAPLLRDKWTDPAVVVVSPDLSWAIPVAGGHHGANRIARSLAGLGIRPVITTATETLGRMSVEAVAGEKGLGILNPPSTRWVNAAILDGDVPVYPVPGPGMVIAGPAVSVLLRKGEYAVGLGCRKGLAEEAILAGLRAGLSEARISPEEVFAYGTTLRKMGEGGLIHAVETLGGNLVFLDDAAIAARPSPSPSRAGLLGLPGVAEPCALALARRGVLVLAKKKYGGMTIAIAR
ncbi:MAG TPA: cobalt-precorrin 5A hydrolase [Methanomicrobiales archaeon]|jgi:cobalt-precorrin 5A hydrolase|nr:cobalt-precorrin 5A hydrolase [Methanomicrobiales archaeon]